MMFPIGYSASRYFLRIQMHYALLCSPWQSQRLDPLLCLWSETHQHRFKGLPQFCVPVFEDLYDLPHKILMLMIMGCHWRNYCPFNQGIVNTSMISKLWNWMYRSMLWHIIVSMKCRRANSWLKSHMWKRSVMLWQGVEMLQLAAYPRGWLQNTQ